MAKFIENETVRTYQRLLGELRREDSMAERSVGGGKHFGYARCIVCKQVKPWGRDWFFFDPATGQLSEDYCLDCAPRMAPAVRPQKSGTEIRTKTGHTEGRKK